MGIHMRDCILASIFAAGALALVPAAFADDAFPPIPKTGVKDMAADKAELEKLSSAGDGLATVYLALQLDCQSPDAACLTQQRTLLKKAIAQGETTAIAMDRLIDVRDDPTRAAAYRISSSVCGQRIENSDALISAITKNKIPAYKLRPRDNEEWKTARIDGALGSKLISISNSAMSILLVYHDGDLQIARIFTLLLEIGSQTDFGSKERWRSTEILNEQVPQIICPDWAGVGTAAKEYLNASMKTPPRGVHVTGKQAWLAVTAVVPDIAWADLYVDPFHDPYTSTLQEEFNFSSSLDVQSRSAFGDRIQNTPGMRR